MISSGPVSGGASRSAVNELCGLGVIVDDRVSPNAVFVVSRCPDPPEPGCEHHQVGIHSAVRLDLPDGTEQ